MTAKAQIAVSAIMYATESYPFVKAAFEKGSILALIQTTL